MRGCVVDGSAISLPDAVHEASGLALSRANPGVLWTHSDAGAPQVLALSLSGAPLGTVRITGAAVEDWEDVAVGPCSGRSCLYIGDIGDNQAERRTITVYRVPEPTPAAGSSSPAEAFRGRYPNGPHDAEALFVDAEGRIHVVTKGETGPIIVYRFPASPRRDSVNPLERVRALGTEAVPRRDRVTGASASADGRWIALRTLHGASIYPSATFASPSGAPAARFDLRGANEAQGEGIALGAGDTVFLSSEGGRKRNPARLTRVVCELPR
jgi:hypothetical protein